jgi:hypothetical protein
MMNYCRVNREDGLVLRVELSDEFLVCDCDSELARLSPHAPSTISRAGFLVLCEYISKLQEEGLPETYYG